jgi:hypothetical protein
MKKIVGIFAIIAIVAMALDGRFNPTYAQAPAQGSADTQAAAPGATDRIFKLADDLNVSVGFKTWFNNWKSDDKAFQGTNPLTVESHGKGWIPTVGLRYKDFFVSASGVIGTDYNHGTIKTLVGFPGDKMGMRRKEMDINLGYFVHPWVALSVGYKALYSNFTCCPPDRFFKVSYDYHSPTLGLSANIPIPEWNEFPSGFSVYGNAGGGYMWVHPSHNAVNNTNHAFYSNFEGGIAYKIPPLPVALSVGYRYQRIETHFKSGLVSVIHKTNGEDITKGAIVGISFVF